MEPRILQRMSDEDNNDNPWVSIVFVGNNSGCYLLAHNPINAEMDDYGMTSSPVLWNQPRMSQQEEEITVQRIEKMQTYSREQLPQMSQQETREKSTCSQDQLVQFLSTIKRGLGSAKKLKEACNQFEGLEPIERNLIVGSCYLSFILSIYETALAQEVFRCIVNRHDLQRVLSETITFIKTQNLSVDCSNIRFWPNECKKNNLTSIRLLEVRIIACAYVLETGLSLDLNSRMLVKREEKETFKPDKIVTSPMMYHCERMLGLNL